MSFLRFADDAAMYDATPLDNMFIIENLPSAPEAFLKVYIYARMLCMHPEMGGVDELSRALRLDMDVIEAAFAYWERAGFMRRVADNPPQYVMTPARGGMMNEMDRDYYKYRDFNGELQSLFPAGKLIHPAQYALANDWLNVLGFSQDAVIALVKGVINTSRSKNPDPARVFKTADKRAAQLADAGITDLAGVEREFMRDERVDQLAREVLHQFGMRRQPSEPEIKLVSKWLKDWQLDPADIISACDVTVKANNPTFAYLDTVLDNRRSSNGSFDKMQQVFRAMGISRRPTDEHCHWYEQLLSEGFEHDTVELAAKQISRRANPSIIQLETLLSKWRERGLFNFQAAGEFITRLQAINREFGQLLHRANIEKRPNEDELNAYADWKQNTPAALIEYAAECSHGKANPIAYMGTLIERWNKAGITTVEAAKSGTSAPRSQNAVRINPALDYDQREYRDEDFNNNAFLEEVRRMREQDALNGKE